MPSKPTTRWQVSGYRFLVRRMEHALVRRDVRMLHDPMRSQSRAYAAGLIMACVVLAGCGVLALLRPQDKIGSNKILIGKDSGAVYVVLDDAVHPALNLASARLAAGDSAKPVIVKESELGKKPRGTLIGIPGAPGSLHFDKDGKGHVWTVCDTLKVDGGNALTMTVMVGDPELGAKAGPLPKDKALLVQGKDYVYLVYNNSRARVDLNDPAVTGPLNIRGLTPRPISEGLLNAIPEVAPIKPPTIDDPGGAPTYPINNLRIGTVVQVADKPNQYWVVLRESLQEISPLTAEIIKASQRNSEHGTKISDFDQRHAPNPVVLNVGTYPQTTPVIVQPKEQQVSCLSWKPNTAASKDSGNRADLSVLTGVNLPLADSAKPVTLAQSDNRGLRADAFYLPPSTGAFLQTTGIEPDSRRKDSMFYIADTGVSYGIKNGDSAKALGMDGITPEPAPWPIVGLLAVGPVLGREEALVAHDGVAPDAAPAKTPASAVNSK
ncbi:type VII secretion protein EccB [Nocardia panacis]|uniref:Type VII secretion protein EccB n=1 Tax=Nocardia panacis TaxID=2340916 RepID=A0A3A4KEP3_9NOCA|nr:type VII secretion protein EccB [Nocardia panacis]RJO72381.1 type VII secretion protein EccB [Nocardia panacis]